MKDITNDLKEFDVFVSYSNEDLAQAEHIRNVLQVNGLRCWFAPRNIGPGDFTEVIPKAMRKCKSFVLVLSKASQASPWVRMEVDYAIDQLLPIFPMALEQFEMNDKFNFMLSRITRYEAYAQEESALRKLVQDLHEVLEKPFPPEPIIFSRNDVSPPTKGHPAFTKNGHTTSSRKDEPPKKKPLLWIGISAAVIALAVMLACIFFLGGGQGEITSGSYLIWNPEYEVGLSGLTSHDYYLAGHVVQDKQVMLRNYPSDCVWQVDVFTDGTVTISQNGQNLGVIPGYTGVGLGGDHTADRWVLEDGGDGLYLIRNQELNVYLQWYAEKDNWSAYGNVSDSKRDTFLLELRKAG